MAGPNKCGPRDRGARHRTGKRAATGLNVRVALRGEGEPCGRASEKCPLQLGRARQRQGHVRGALSCRFQICADGTFRCREARIHLSDFTRPVGASERPGRYQQGYKRDNNEGEDPGRRL